MPEKPPDPDATETNEEEIRHKLHVTTDTWTTFAADLTRLAEDVLHAIEHRVDDNQELALGALYARAYQSFLGTIQLAETGLTDDASTLIRSMVESTIAIREVNRDANFIQRLIEDEQYNLRAAAKAHQLFRAEAAKLLGDDDETSDTPLEPRAEDEEPPEIPYSGLKLRRIKWPEVASQSHDFLVKHLYNAHYRPMCSHVHVALSSLRAVHTGANFTHIDWRPSRAATAETLARACDVMLWATMTLIGHMHLNTLRPALERLRDRDATLLQKLP